MAGNVLSEIILIIASVIIATMLSTTVMSKVSVFESAFTESTEVQKEITLTKIKIIYATNSTNAKVNTWIKNIGVNPVSQLDLVDVYFGKLGTAQRIPYNTGVLLPTWNYSSMPSVWQAKGTVQINVYDNANLQKNATYSIKVTTPNGVSDDHIFSIS